MFQQCYSFHTLHRDPSILISFVVLSADHFFVVVFDYHRDSAFVLGRHISGNISAAPCPSYDGQLDDWNLWNGPLQYWKHISILHSIDAVEHDHVNVEILSLSVLTQAISMYSGEAKKRSYGVRNGCRMSGIVMDYVMLGLHNRVNHFHHVMHDWTVVEPNVIS